MYSVFGRVILGDKLRGMCNLAVSEISYGNLALPIDRYRFGGSSLPRRVLVFHIFSMGSQMCLNSCCPCGILGKSLVGELAIYSRGCQ